MTTRASTHAWFNGEITAREAGAPSVASISFHLGTGVFDGLIAYWNAGEYYLHRVRDHLLRFEQGAARMGLTYPWSVDDLTAAIHELLAHEPVGTQYIRPIAYRRAPELWITGSEGKEVDISIFTVQVDRDSDLPITCHISPIERISSRAIPAHTKVSGAYVNSFNARKHAEKAGFDDGIMLDRHGRVTEASAANVFAIVGDQLLTPPLHPDVFPGITRAVIIELAGDCGIPVREAVLSPQELMSADGVFLCSTLMEIRGVSRLDQRTLDTHRHPLFTTLVSAFRDLTHGRAHVRPAALREEVQWR